MNKAVLCIVPNQNDADSIVARLQFANFSNNYTQSLASRCKGKTNSSNVLISVRTKTQDDQQCVESIFRAARANDICSTSATSVPKSIRFSAAIANFH